MTLRSTPERATAWRNCHPDFVRAVETLILKFIDKNNKMNWKPGSGDVINERSDKVRERELPSKTHADVHLYEEISVYFNALSIPALWLRAPMAKF